MGFRRRRSPGGAAVQRREGTVVGHPHARAMGQGDDVHGIVRHRAFPLPHDAADRQEHGAHRRRTTRRARRNLVARTTRGPAGKHAPAVVLRGQRRAQRELRADRRDVRDGRVAHADVPRGAHPHRALRRRRGGGVGGIDPLRVSDAGSHRARGYRRRAVRG